MGCEVKRIGGSSTAPIDNAVAKPACRSPAASSPRCVIDCYRAATAVPNRNKRQCGIDRRFDDLEFAFRLRPSAAGSQRPVHFTRAKITIPIKCRGGWDGDQIYPEDAAEQAPNPATHHQDKAGKSQNKNALDRLLPGGQHVTKEDSNIAAELRSAIITGGGI